MYVTKWSYWLQNGGGPFEVVGSLKSCARVYAQIKTEDHKYLQFVGVYSLDGDVECSYLYQKPIPKD